MRWMNFSQVIELKSEWGLSSRDCRSGHSLISVFMPTIVPWLWHQCFAWVQIHGSHGVPS